MGLECATASCGRVLISDHDPDALRVVRRVVEQAGFGCTVVDDLDDVADVAADVSPDAVILGIDATPSGRGVVRTLRAGPATRSTPIIVMTAAAPAAAMHLLSLADDYVSKPIAAEELVARLHVVLHRSRGAADVQGMTGLPGGASISAEVLRRLGEGIPFAYLYVDIDNFRPYNDAHGIHAGDGVICATAEVLREAVDQIAPAGAFIGHIAGDDFVVLADVDAAEPLARTIVRMFDARIPSFHSRAERERGYIERRDRRGVTHEHSLMSLSIGIVRTDRRRFVSPIAVADVATEMKTVAQREARSAWATDRRRDDAPVA